MFIGMALVGKLSWFNEKVNVVLDGNGDFFHERAVWVTFAESKVTKQQVFAHCGERISELRFRVSFGSPQKKPKTLHF